MENEKKETIFTDGLIFKKPREGAPDFIKGNMSFKVNDFIAFLQKHNNNGWVNVDLKVSKGGKLYTQLNDWKLKEENSESGTISQKSTENTAQGQIEGNYSYPTDDINPEDIPF